MAKTRPADYKTFTANCIGDFRDLATSYSLKSYYANGTTAVEIPIHSKEAARAWLKNRGFNVVYVFE